MTTDLPIHQLDSGGSLKPAGFTDPSFTVAMNDYLDKFKYKVVVKLGPSYGTKFKEFNEWCEQRLGTKYKDWFLYIMDKDRYMLFMTDPKWSSFLALTWVDSID